MTDAEIQAEAEQCYGQFISSKPHRNSYVGGFICGAMWARAEHEAELARKLSAELAALRERAEGLEEVARWAVATIAKGPPSAYTIEAVARRLSAALAERPRGATP